MQIDITSRAVRTRLQERSADRELARVATHEPELARFKSCSVLLEFLGERGVEHRSDRNRVVGALLRLSQRHRSRIALELLYVAYFPTLAELAGELFRYRRTRDIDECQAVAVEAFFEATQLVRPHGDGGTALLLVLKTRQRAIRECDACERRQLNEEPSDELFAERSHLVGPEAELLRRESEPLVLEIERSLDPLLELPCDDGVSLRETLAGDDRSLFRQLRRLHPEEDLVAVMRRYQRARARRSRYLRSARKKSQQTLSQLRGYLDILDQEVL